MAEWSYDLYPSKEAHFVYKKNPGYLGNESAIYPGLGALLLFMKCAYEMYKIRKMLRYTIN